MKTHNKHNRKLANRGLFTMAFAALLFIVGHLNAPRSHGMTGGLVCGYCYGSNWLYYACDWNNPPCSGTCTVEGLPPGCYGRWLGFDQGCKPKDGLGTACGDRLYTGDTTSRNGNCQPDCSCILQDPPFPDHVVDAPVCYQEGNHPECGTGS